jgi:hypothetical protein
MFSQLSASPAVITPKPLAAADRVISYLCADSGLGVLNRIRLNVGPWTRPLRSGRLTFADTELEFRFSALQLVPPPLAIPQKEACHADITTNAITTNTIVAP